VGKAGPNRTRFIGAIAIACWWACGCGRLGIAGLRPLDRMPALPASRESTRVDLKAPVLRWESFPRTRDEAVFGPGARQRISDVTYDLRLWRETTSAADLTQGATDPPVATGLREPRYAIGKLEPGRYHWTVRTRFRLDGQPRVSQWTQLVYDEGIVTEVLDMNSLTFQGPFR
jgi:hypothetical protein